MARKHSGGPYKKPGKPRGGFIATWFGARSPEQARKVEGIRQRRISAANTGRKRGRK